MSKSSHNIGSVLHRLGVAGPVRSRTFQGAGALIAVLGSLVFASAPAQAAIAHKYISSLTGEPGGFFGSEVCGVTVDPATQDLYVADPGNNVIDIFEPSGGDYTYKSQISGSSVPGGSLIDENGPCAVAVSDVTGDVYVTLGPQPVNAEGYETPSVYVFDALGDWIKTINGSGTPEEGGTPQGRLDAGPLYVAVDQSSGDVYVYGVDGFPDVQGGGSYADRFNSANEYISQFKKLERLEGLATNSSGDVYLYGGGDVYEFNSAGGQIAQIAAGKNGNEYSGIAVDAAGDVYVTHEGSYEHTTSQERKVPVPVEEFDPAGELLGQIEGVPGRAFSIPESVTVNAIGDVFVANGSSLGVLDSPGAVDVFGPGVVVPGTTFAAPPPSSVSPTIAALSGSVNPTGVLVTSCEFEYGTEAGVYPDSQECEQSPADIGSGTSAVTVSATLKGLAANTTYYFRLNAANANGNAYEANLLSETFVTPGAPRVNNESAEVNSTEKTGQTHATLQATIDPDERETTYHFEYGETESYGTSVPIPPGVMAAGGVPEPVTAKLSGLYVGTTYHYRVVASNECEAGKTCTGYGPDQTFTTVAAALIQESAANVTDTSATLKAQVNPLGSDTTCQFQYITDASFRSTGYETAVSLPCTAGLGEGETFVSTSVVPQDLAPDTVYDYRVVTASSLAPAGVDGPDQTFTTQPLGSIFELPDGRQWEMVSPPDKYGALIEPIRSVGLIEAAANGGALTYVTDSPTEAEPQGYVSLVQVLATRGPGGWSDRDIDVRHNEAPGAQFGGGLEYRFFSSDLSSAIFQTQGYFTPLTGEETSPQASEATPYERANATCQATPATCYTPLATTADVTSGAEFGYISKITAGGVKEAPVKPVGATPDLHHVVLTVEGKGHNASLFLTEQPAPPSSLYEWSAEKPPAEQLQLVNILPASEGGAPAPSAIFGAWESEENHLTVKNAISEDGSRVVWSTQKALYMRDTATEETVRLDTVQGGSGSGRALPEFDLASSDGSRVFFTDSQQLTADSGAAEGARDLYECQIVEVEEAGHKRLKCDLFDLTPAGQGGERADVQGTVLGAGEDGSYVYFVADGVLGDGAEHGASAGECGVGGKGANPRGTVKEEEETCSLYAEHYDGSGWEAPRFIATLSDWEDDDWLAERLGVHTSGVSPDGRYLAFMSRQELTGYDNTDVSEEETYEDEEGEGPETKVHHDQEVYEYHAAENPGRESGRLICASCNPTGARPKGEVYARTHEENKLVGGESVWMEGTWLAANIPGWVSFAGKNNTGVHQPRYLSNDGRLFFNSHEALVPQDVNGTWDVYQYEPPGTGSCSEAAGTYSPRSGGCVGLISSGESDEESAFLDASESGGDVFFLTASQLVPQDTDSNLDVYDARECASESLCLPASAETPPPCTTEASCKPAPEPQPSIYGAPASATFVGPGNLAPPPPAVVKKVTTKTVTCKKGFVKKKVKNKQVCVKKPRKRSTKSSKKKGK